MAWGSAMAGKCARRGRASRAAAPYLCCTAKIHMESLCAERRERSAWRQPSSTPQHSADNVPAHHGPAEALPKLMLGAIGVVFGDIGTSPLYALQATLDPRYHLRHQRDRSYGIVSLIFWSFVLVVTIKYVFIVMRCDNKGEGGSLRFVCADQRATWAQRHRSDWLLIGALFATALFFADAMLTPAISVISAVEGLGVVSAAFQPLHRLDRARDPDRPVRDPGHGTERVGKMFGPIMLVYFAAIAAMGVHHILGHPQVLQALSPVYIWGFFAAHPVYSFLSLGAVIYAVTGTEALYADMGHFGRKPIACAWLYLVCPGADAQLHGPGGNAARASAIRRQSLLPHGAAVADHPAAGHCDTGDDHRQPGGHLRRLFGRRSRRSSSASSRGCASRTPRSAQEGRSTCRPSTGCLP